ncbi:MAG: Fe-S cluster assembly protein SufD [Armatimonadetes bacterium]|nr:Fe-S cluster assembly protein SufD [Armatimonadota bacterium]
MTPLAHDLNSYQAGFEWRERHGGGDDPVWLREMRGKAIAQFLDTGFPGTDEEEWRFTNLAPIAERSYRLPEFPTLEASTIRRIASLPVVAAAHCRLVFVNGYLIPELSSTSHLHPSVQLQNIASAALTSDSIVERELSQYAAVSKSSFTALNTAFLHDGAYVRVVPSQAVDEPIYLIYVTVPAADPVMIFPRNLILIGENSTAKLVEVYLSLADGIYWNNAVSETVIGEGARLEHIKYQLEAESAFHISTQQSHIGRDAVYSSTSIAMGSRLARNNLNAILAGMGGECTLNGLYLIAGNQRLDNHTLIEHTVPECASHELYKGILNGHSHAVFNGRVRVRPGAQKTDAKQTNKNLLLSNDALVNTQPQLEIYADDVKCTHGATIGQLDEEAVFYLRSRGIDLEAASGLLTYGFASDVIDRVSVEPLRNLFNDALRERLPQGLPD